MSNLHPVFAAALKPWTPPVSHRIRTTLEWIPTLEECPEPGTLVLVSVAGEKEAMEGFFDGTTWCLKSGHEINGHATHWCERPMGITP